nr:MAG TPA: replisome organizer [Caudoviricetes sp.]
MADVQWIRITTDMFDNRKIKHLRKLPEGNNIVLIWVMLLTMAGRCNAGGMIFLTENIPYTTKMLADELDFEENTIRLALQVFEELHMVTTDREYLRVPGWEEYQNVEGLDRIRAQTRTRVANHRERKKLSACNVTGNVTVTHGNAAEEDKEVEVDIENNKTSSLRSEVFVAPEPAATPQTEPTKQIPYAKIQEIYNRLCTNMPKCTALSEMRRKAIRARFAAGYKLEDFEQMFSKAAQSSFLNGANDRNFMANFDWLIKDANMAKVLSGNYEDRAGNAYGRERTSGNIFMEMLREEEGRQRGSI